VCVDVPVRVEVDDFQIWVHAQGGRYGTDGDRVVASDRNRRTFADLHADSVHGAFGRVDGLEVMGRESVDSVRRVFFEDGC